MKFYLITTFLILIFSQLIFGQNIQNNDNKSELPKLNKESLQVEADVELFPNPATDFLNISLGNSRLKNVQFEMYNIIGNKLDFELDAVSSNSYKVNVKDLHQGYYLLIVKDPISRYNKAFKFRKQ